jgi:hypothetical protein
MDADLFGFDPGEFTDARLQTEGWIRFTDPPEEVFSQLANHEGMTAWVPLLKKVTVTHPHELAPGESAIGTTRELTFQGGIALVERIVFWNAPLCYAYDTHGKVFPLQNYIGLMGVEPAKNGGGIFIFREYFDVKGRVKQAVIPHGVVPPMRKALHSLSQLIGGTEYEVKHVKAKS